VIYIIGIVGIAFLGLMAAIKVELVEVKLARADRDSAVARETKAKAANTALQADVKALDAKYAQSQADLAKVRDSDARRIATAAAELAALDRRDKAKGAKIAELEAAAQRPTQGDPNATAVSVLHELAGDLMRDDR
jgi:hypothetical protein